MKLTTKFLSLIIFLVLIGEILMYGAARQLAEQLVGDVMVRYGQVVSKYDTEKTLAPLFKEVNIAKELAQEPIIKAWAQQPLNGDLSQQAYNVLEKYRWRFISKSYSAILLNNNGYYHNDADNQYAHNPLQYTLDPHSETDQWFYHSIDNQTPLDININPDLHLGVIKIWINALIEVDGQPLGKIGTGLDYDHLLKDWFSDSDEMKGVSTLIVDKNRRIKFHRKDGVAVNAYAKDHYHESKSLMRYITRMQDISALDSLIASVDESDDMATGYIVFEGHKQLALVSDIPQLSWYEITFIDINRVLPNSIFMSLYVIFGSILLVFIVLISVALRRWVTQPLSLFDQYTELLARDGASQVNIHFARKPRDEIGHLMTHFEHMAQIIKNSTEQLERKVAERTSALDRLANVDALTELLNRRGMEAELTKQMSESARNHTKFCILWIDVDDFKGVNDSLGHDKGDSALQKIAETINEVRRDYDIACRWGGDEFLVLIKNDASDHLYELAERFRSKINELVISSEDGSVRYMLSVSVGATVVEPEMNIKHVLRNADEALYEAKSSGRNSVSLWQTQLKEEAKEQHDGSNG